MPEKVAILSVRAVPLPGSPGATREMLRIVYQGERMLPRTVYVDPAHDSAEERARIIAEDLAAARAATPDEVTIP